MMKDVFAESESSKESKDDIFDYDDTTEELTRTVSFIDTTEMNKKNSEIQLVYVAMNNTASTSVDPLGLSSLRFSFSPFPPKKEYELSFVTPKPQGEKVGDCGDVSWVILWKVKPRKTGIVVQKVTFKWKIKYCDKKDVVPMEPFTSQGKSSPVTFWEPFLIDPDSYSTDQWRIPGPFPETKGSVKIVGKAWYKADPTLTDYPPAFDVPPTPPQLNPITYTDPGIAADSNTVKRKLKASWKCCCGSKDMKTTFWRTPDPE